MESESIIDFSYIYFTLLEENAWVFVPLTLLLFAFWMYLLGSTADEYLWNALETISDNLKISETISAITLLALGNGAPDIFASFSAAGSDDGIYLSLSSSMGGLVFITAVVTSIVIFTAGDDKVKTEQSVFYRNILFLAAALTILLFSGLVRQWIDIATWAIFLFIYILYIVFVVKHDNEEQAMKSRQDWMFNEMKQTSFKRMNRSEFLSLMDEEVAYHQGIKPSGEISGTSSVVYDGEEIQSDKMLHFSIESGEKLNEQIKLDNGFKESSWAKVKHMIFKESSSNEQKYQKQYFFSHILSYIQLRRVTIPMTHPSKWNRNLDSWTPFLSVLMFLYVSGMLNLLDPIQLIVLATAFSLSLSMRFNTYNSEPPAQVYTALLIILSFVMSIVWIWMLANIVVDLITIYGHIFNISSTFLGVSFLAVGNCIGDAMASMSIARKGYGGMAMIGCFACPLFNFLIGFSLSSWRILLLDEKLTDEPLFARRIEFNLFDEKARVSIIAISFILWILGIFLYGVPQNNYKYSRKQAIVKCVIYGGFISFLLFLLFT